MSRLIISLYRWLMARPALYTLNLHLYKLSLRGLGILNSGTAEATGEPYFLKKLSQNWQPQVIIDVGSNTDAYGVDFFSNATIYAIEPHPQTFKKLKKKFAHQRRIKPFNYAISNRNGKAKLWDFADEAELKSTQPTSQLSSLNRDVIEQLHGQPAQAFSVTKKTINQFIKEEKIDHIDFLKIDTEGHELQVLQGAQKALKAKKIAIVQFEFNEMNVQSGVFLRDFMTLLPNHDFYRLLPEGLISLDNYRPLTHEIFGFQNIIAFPKEMSDIVAKM